MIRQNVTLSLPVDLLKKAKHLAIDNGSSLSALLAGFIERAVNESEEREAASKRIVERLQSGLEFGTLGALRWTRDELHER